MTYTHDDKEIDKMVAWLQYRLCGIKLTRAQAEKLFKVIEDRVVQGLQVPAH